MTQNRSLSSAAIASSLSGLGIEPGDLVYLQLDDCSNAQLQSLFGSSRCERLIDAICDLLGEEGTLVMPTFTYSFSRGEIFDLQCSASAMGPASEAFRCRPEVRRSANPMFSVAARGRHAAAFAEADADDCFGVDTAFGVLHALNGTILNLGANFSRLAFIHYVEQTAEVDYRVFRQFSGIVEEADGTQWPAEVRSFVRHPRRPDGFNYPRLRGWLSEKAMLATAKMGQMELLAIKAHDLFTGGDGTVAPASSRATPTPSPGKR
ncbi:MAG: AAC(3) family N-acetyltransferase [Rhodospirillales bacterium]|nr:AAC(3) family N-acetyltransferase [Rhodospirillales bacterium]